MNIRILNNVLLIWVVTTLIGTIVLSLDWAVSDPFGVGSLRERIRSTEIDFLKCLAISIPGFLTFYLFLTIPRLAALVKTKVHKCLLAFAIVLITYIGWRFYAFSRHQPFSFGYVKVYAMQLSFYFVPFALCILVFNFSPKKPFKFDFESSGQA